MSGTHAGAVKGWETRRRKAGASATPSRPARASAARPALGRGKGMSYAEHEFGAAMARRDYAAAVRWAEYGNLPRQEKQARAALAEQQARARGRRKKAKR